MKPHKWAKEIKAWADGADIEFLDSDTGRWITKMYDGWDIEAEYRIKPQPNLNKEFISLTDDEKLQLSAKARYLDLTPLLTIELCCAMLKEKNRG